LRELYSFFPSLAMSLAPGWGSVGVFLLSVITKQLAGNRL
jgi:hypothetical protein